MHYAATPRPVTLKLLVPLHGVGEVWCANLYTRHNVLELASLVCFKISGSRLLHCSLQDISQDISQHCLHGTRLRLIGLIQLSVFRGIRL